MRMLAIVAILAIPTLVSTQERGDSVGRERYTAAAMSGGGPRSNPVATNVDITIDRWSTAADRKRLLDAMRKGQDELLKALQETRAVGSIRTPGNLAYDLHYAHQVKGEDGGKRIFLATDRPITAWEAINRPAPWTIRSPSSGWM
jgi:hypothetical protein